MTEGQETRLPGLESLGVLSAETIRPLDQPVLILLQEPNPDLFEESDRTKTRSFISLQYPLSPHVVSELSKVYYEPYLFIPPGFDRRQLKPLLEQGRVEKAGNFGPFQTYRFIDSESPTFDQALYYGTRSGASRELAGILGDLTYIQPEIDKPVKVLEVRERYFKGVGRSERLAMKQDLEMLLQEKLLTPLTGEKVVTSFPLQLLEGLKEVEEYLFEQVDKLPDGQVKSDPKDPNWLKWHFCQGYILPLRQYLEYRLDRAMNDAQAADCTIQAVADYDFSIDLLHQMAEQINGEQGKPDHFGFLIPAEQFELLQSGKVRVEFTNTDLLIHHGSNVYTYPLPERSAQGEVAFKGGLARIVTKAVLGLDVESELPPSDVDIVVFGEGIDSGTLSQKYGVEVKDIERMQQRDLNAYLGNRDSALNEVLVTRDGLVISLNGLAAYYQRTTEASADPVKNIHGEHVLHTRLGYFEEGADVADFMLVSGTRIPSPRAFMRMGKLFIDDKVETITVPAISLRMTVDETHWLVLARKILSEENRARRARLLSRMLGFAALVNNPYFRGDYEEDRSGPFRFIEAVADGFEQKYGRRFDMKSKLSDKETLDWLAGRLTRQIIQRFNSFYGAGGRKRFEESLQASDLRPVQLVLPISKDADTRPLKDEGGDETGDSEFDLRQVDPERLLQNQEYAGLYARHAERNRQLNRLSELSMTDVLERRREIFADEADDEATNLQTEKERQEYLYWYVKYRALQDSRLKIDPGMFPILWHLNRLPISTHSSDSGHIIPGTNRLVDDFFPALNLYFYQDISDDEQQVQREFRNHLDDLNIAICQRLGEEPYNIFSLRGELIEFGDGGMQELSIEETLAAGGDLYMYLTVVNPDLVNNRGREVLSVVWEEFTHYMNRFTPTPMQVPDFGNGDIFVKNVNLGTI